MDLPVFCVKRVRVVPKGHSFTLKVEAKCPNCDKTTVYEMTGGDGRPVTMGSLIVDIGTLREQGCSHCISHCKFEAADNMRVVWY